MITRRALVNRIRSWTEVSEVRWGGGLSLPQTVNLLVISESLPRLVIVKQLSIRWQPRQIDILNRRDRLPKLELRHPGLSLAGSNSPEQTKARASGSNQVRSCQEDNRSDGSFLK